MRDEASRKLRLEFLRWVGLEVVAAEGDDDGVDLCRGGWRLFRLPLPFCFSKESFRLTQSSSYLLEGSAALGGSNIVDTNFAV